MPIDQDMITNSDESKKLPDDTPSPTTGNQSEDQNIAKPDLGGNPLQAKETDILDTEPEGEKAEGNVAASNEEDTHHLDGSNANNLRTK
ncbi:hypothetical protein GU926_17915 [Nibribacter ruber]|uniref:Uncharacterized protein n=1 Tax=Nibribacter ruber TaxID=2698458 RepID=A0A6P1P425_9BACT|nr:hypothetical protein [Nibribacter ruber]QHL89204.1 hypothetical protein GU926_17915 [Nibribacter ruber]